VSDGKVFEHVAAGIHDRDDDAGQRLTKHQCAHHGNERDRIHTHAARPNVANDRNQQTDDDRDRAAHPTPIRQIVPAGGPGHKPENEANKGDGAQRSSQESLRQQQGHPRCPGG